MYAEWSTAWWHTLTDPFPSSRAEIRKPGTAPGNTGGAPTAAALPQSNGFTPDPAPPPRQAAQPAPMPASQQAPFVPEAVQPAVRAAPASRSTSRYPSRREATGIPGPGGAPAPAPAAAPLPTAYHPAPPAAPAPERWQAPPPQPPQQHAQAQQQSWGTPPTTSSSGDDVLGAIMAAEDDLITTHRCETQAAAARKEARGTQAACQLALASPAVLRPHGLDHQQAGRCSTATSLCRIPRSLCAGSTLRTAWLPCATK